MIHFGDIPPEALILHKCDNRKCVNPNHLYPGTYIDNRRDAITRNHLPISNFYAGEAWLMKRLWNSGKFSWAKIGRMFECSRYTVGNICTGKVKNFREIDKSLPTLKHLISQLRNS